MGLPADPATFFSQLHSYLASLGVDGVKVDVQNQLELAGSAPGEISGTQAVHRQSTAALHFTLLLSGQAGCQWLAPVQNQSMGSIMPNPQNSLMCCLLQCVRCCCPGQPGGQVLARVLCCKEKHHVPQLHGPQSHQLAFDCRYLGRASPTKGQTRGDKEVLMTPQGAECAACAACCIVVFVTAAVQARLAVRCWRPPGTLHWRQALPSTSQETS